MTTSLHFHKMHGLGNDFILIDTDRFSLPSPEQIQLLADRHTGIGFDQCLAIKAIHSSTIDFQYRIFNADGSEAEQCGNGARCVAAFIAKQKLSPKNCLQLQCLGGLVQSTCLTGNLVEINFGHSPHQLELFEMQPTTDHPSLQITKIDLGNPHAVFFASPQTPLDFLSETAAQLIQSPYFPQGVNCEQVIVLDNHHLAVRVFERGVGETKACGSGACAAAIAAIYHQQADNPVTVTLPGGDLQITWSEDKKMLTMTGPTTYVYEGSIKLEV